MGVVQSQVLDPGFWNGKRVLLTGHTGFKGAWLSLWLRRLGAIVVGVSLPPVTRPSLFALADLGNGIESHFCDIRDSNSLTRLVRDARPEIVMHLAAQALVRAGYRVPADTFATNTQGTVNVLEAIRGLDSVRVLVAVTTDKVYLSDTNRYPHRETDALGGIDPYSASKAAAEMVVASYRESYFSAARVAVASARAGNVIGGGDWSEDRLLPDAIRAWSGGVPLRLRLPNAVRPWQHVLDPLAGYLRLIEMLWLQPELAGPYNFGPRTHQAAPVCEVISLAKAAYGGGEVIMEANNAGQYEADWLALEVAKSRSVLGVQARWGLEEAVRRSIDWYRRQSDGVAAAALCAADIDAFEATIS